MGKGRKEELNNGVRDVTDAGFVRFDPDELNNRLADQAEAGTRPFY